MITDAGLHALVGLLGDTDSPADFTYIAYGYGTAAESGTQALTQTGSRAAATVEVLSILKPNDTVRFSANVVTADAANATEIAVFTAATGGTMLLRKLVVPALTYKINDTLSLTANVTIKNYAKGTDDNDW